MKSKILWSILLLAIVGVAAAAAWQWWKIAQTNALPEGIVSGNGRIESIQVDVAAKYGGRIKEILARGRPGRGGTGPRQDGYGGAGGRAGKSQGKLAETEAAASEARAASRKMKAN